MTTGTRFGTVRREGRRHVLRYERTLRHPVAAVWAAITEPGEVVGWLAAVEELDLRVGGAIVLRWQNVPDDLGEWEAQGVELGDHDPAAPVRGTITRLDAPLLFEYETDSMGLLRFELTPEGDTTLLVFTNEIELPDGIPAEQTAAGWHMHLDYLDDALDGRPVDWAHEDLARWTAIRDGYGAR